MTHLANRLDHGARNVSWSRLFLSLTLVLAGAGPAGAAGETENAAVIGRPKRAGGHT
jgi:hypothetical protein